MAGPGSTLPASKETVDRDDNTMDEDIEGGEAVEDNVETQKRTKVTKKRPT
jgi:hypothetical protein